MWEEEVRIYGIPEVHNNFPWSKGFYFPSIYKTFKTREWKKYSLKIILFPFYSLLFVSSKQVVSEAWLPKFKSFLKNYSDQSSTTKVSGNLLFIL